MEMIATILIWRNLVPRALTVFGLCSWLAKKQQLPSDWLAIDDLIFQRWARTKPIQTQDLFLVDGKLGNIDKELFIYSHPETMQLKAKVSAWIEPFQASCSSAYNEWFSLMLEESPE